MDEGTPEQGVTPQGWVMPLLPAAVSALMGINWNQSPPNTH